MSQKKWVSMFLFPGYETPIPVYLGENFPESGFDITNPTSSLCVGKSLAFVTEYHTSDYGLTPQLLQQLHNDGRGKIIVPKIFCDRMRLNSQTLFWLCESTASLDEFIMTFSDKNLLTFQIEFKPKGQTEIANFIHTVGIVKKEESCLIFDDNLSVPQKEGTHSYPYYSAILSQTRDQLIRHLLMYETQLRRIGDNVRLCAVNLTSIFTTSC